MISFPSEVYFSLPNQHSVNQHSFSICFPVSFLWQRTGGHRTVLCHGMEETQRAAKQEHPSAPRTMPEEAREHPF